MAFGLTSRLIVTASLALVVTQAVACWDNRCGPGERLEGAGCMPLSDGATDTREDASPDSSPAGDSSPAVDGGADATQDDDSAPGDGAPPPDSVDGGGGIAGMGDVCTKQQECTQAADFCAIQPGSPSGYCTIKDCEVGGDDCPAPYFCMDLSAFLPGLSACIKV